MTYTVSSGTLNSSIPYHTHLQQSRISKFSGGGPLDPLFKGREEREGKGKGRREGKDREGKEGREVTREGGRGGMGVWWEGRGGALDMGSAPLETSSGSARVVLLFCLIQKYRNEQ